MSVIATTRTVCKNGGKPEGGDPTAGGDEHDEGVSVLFSIYRRRLEKKRREKEEADRE